MKKATQQHLTHCVCFRHWLQLVAHVWERANVKSGFVIRFASADAIMGDTCSEVYKEYVFLERNNISFLTTIKLTFFWNKKLSQKL